MKNKILPHFLLTSALVLSQVAFADEPADKAPTRTPAGNDGCYILSNDPQNIVCPVNQNQSNRMSRGEKCSNDLALARQKLTAARSVAGPALQSVVNPDPRGPAFAGLRGLENCRQLQLAAQANGEDLLAERSQAVSQDGRINCMKYGGHTLDWKSCKSGLDAYNMIVVADAALDLTQQMRTTQSGEKLNQKFAQEIQQGNGQNAAYEASIQHNRNLANMNKEKVAAYTAAVAMLGTKIASWQGKSTNSLRKLCSNPNVKVLANSTPQTQLTSDDVRHLPHMECPTALEAIKGSTEVFANESGRSALINAFMQYMAKAVAAGIAAKNLSDIAKQVEQVKDNLADPGPTMFERCALNPMDPVCQQPGQRVPGQEYVSGDFNIDGIGNNVFGPSLEDQANIDLEDPLNNTPGDQIADASSPFEDAAKEANKIMDPAAAANAQPSGGAQGGGGGGAGGGMGGGGVSLGNDLKGPDTENKAADVKAEKSDGNYNFAGGGGFQAIKPGKDDANPFASLFDSQPSQGGVTEDRSIASDDIGGKDSGLFLRISKRYGKISGEKRIEAMNLE